jgi:serine/threonine protein kinase/tetratricopeptide (TPR) repeat protein
VKDLDRDQVARSKEIFLAAVKLPQEEWSTFLADACGADGDLRRRVQGLLDAHREARGFLGDTAPAGAAPAGEPPITEGPGTVIGPYRLLEEIGEGGMGLVFAAEQEHPVRRRVALKVIRPGMDTRQVIARFEAERQALALMDHPNVARVLDAGATDSGRPYFVMELIQGVPITFYCDHCEMPTRERLGLFVQVCRGVQHAHQKGIIHRDVKPTNVLVAIEDGRPVAKVIDFGVAKAIDQQLTHRTIMTGFAQIVGTPLYMSPEQAEMSPLALDTRTDVYSLGVLLYELLTGTTPFEGRQLGEAAFDEVRRVIRDVEPPTPSTRISALGERASAVAERRRTDPRRHFNEVRGDLDWISMKALEKDRARRYETASALAADVERFLGDQPVEACPPSAVYRLRKLIRRNRSAVAVAACLIAAFLVLVGSAGWIASDRASRRALLEREVSDAIDEAASSYRSDRVADAVAFAKRAEALLERGGASAELAGRVLQWRSALHTVVRLDEVRSETVREGDEGFDWADADAAYRELLGCHGVSPEMQNPAEVAARLRASAIREDLLAALDGWVLARSFIGAPGQDVLLDVARLADGDPWRNRLREAVGERDRDALLELARDEALPAQPAADILLLGRVLRELGEGPAAVEILRRAQRERPADFWINVTLGYSLEDSDPVQGAGFYRAALALRPTSFAAHLGLGNCLLEKGDLDGAIAVYRRGIALNPTRAKLHVNLGVALSKAGRHDEEESVVRRAIELQPELVQGHYNLAQNLYKTGRLDEAIPLYRRAIELMLAAPRDPAGDTHRALLYRPHEQLGNLFMDQGKIDEAIAEWRKAIEIRSDRAEPYIGITEALGKKGDLEGALAASRKAVELEPRNAKAQYNLGVALAGQGNPNDAAVAYQKAIQLDPTDAQAITNLAVLLNQEGKKDEALAALRKAAKLDPALFTAHFNLGSVLADLGKLDEAAVAYRRALELDPTSTDALQCLGIVLGQEGKLEEAVAELEKAIALRPNDARAHGNLASALLLQGKIEEAIAERRRAVEIEPDHAVHHGSLANTLRDSGQLAEALVSFKRCHELGSRDRGWQYPSAGWITDCEKLIELEGRLPRVLAGEESLVDGEERLAFADLAYRTRRFDLAARFFEEALAAGPGLANEPPGVHRYNAACAAALAGAGEGRDAGMLDGEARARRRAQALAWLRAELAEAASRWEKDTAARAGVVRALRHWLRDPDLKGLRDGDRMSALPPEEREECAGLWRDVEELLRRGAKKEP